MSFFVPLLIGILSVVLPGYFLALALLKKTGMPMFEIAAIGVIFGLLFPPALTWFESYFMDFVHFFAFSESLYIVNVAVLTVIGIALCVQQGAMRVGLLGRRSEQELKSELNRDYKIRLASLRGRLSELGSDVKIIREHQKEEEELAKRHKDEMALMKDAGAEERMGIEEHHLKQEKELFEEHEKEELMLIGNAAKSAGWFRNEYVWIILLALMLVTFATRIENIGVASKYFEFDPYFDMLSTGYIIVHGYQPYYDHSAWPVEPSGTLHRIEPIVPYLEAFWYDISNNPHVNSASIDTNLMSTVSSFYPPVVAALLVFVVFMLLYHQYGRFPALIGAALAAAMPALITTFIAGEQLLEPWGIFAMFFFYASYMLAVSNPKEKRYAVLAGIAFASNFLGAHYYIVPTAILSIYIILQGVLNVLRKEDNHDFYVMNGIVLLIITITFALYDPYGGTLNSRIPYVLGFIPVTIAFPLFSYLFIALFERLPLVLEERKVLPRFTVYHYLAFLLLLVAVVTLLVLFTSLGNSVRGYIDISKRFTTPSKPLFMTVQEYTPTGPNFNFGSAGFGFIGSMFGGVSLFVWFALIIFTVLALLAIYYRNSKTSIFAVAAVWPLAIAGMIEIKYLPHFGVGYIVAIGIILGELLLIVGKEQKKTMKYALYGIGAVIVLFEMGPLLLQAIPAAFNSNCASLSQYQNSIGLSMYCNTVPNYWLSATQWMRSNVGPHGPRILSWWDYGDWINWFGNSNAVLRGDNAVAQEDYDTAAQFVFGPADGYNSSTLAAFMDKSQAKYVLFDDQLLPKWGALNFLACIDVNQTSMAYAFAQGKPQGQPYALGTSNCEVTHAPAYVVIPVSTSINNYCTFSNSSVQAMKGVILSGGSYQNASVCIPVTFLQNAFLNGYLANGVKTSVYYENGTKSNIVLVSDFFGGVNSAGGQTIVSFVALYTPNGPNGTITDAPSRFYDSNFYKGFFLGKLPGLTLVYPGNVAGVNYINSTNKIMIFQIDNYTGSLPALNTKPPWISNNYTMPG
ncbi:MAG: hypothetical protein KGH50_00265 [Candidatus Micrarchaeota archaeon]|nr:hypothetical protein [Candidatus Micrarchaeota archaeon]